MNLRAVNTGLQESESCADKKAETAYVLDKKADLPVLLVEQDEGLRKNLCLYLGECAPSGIVDADTEQGAAEALQKGGFSCIFLGGLPKDQYSISFLKKIYDPASDLAAAPVVSLAVPGDEASILEVLRYGAQDYILKDNISATTIRLAMARAKELFQLKSSRNSAEEQLQHVRRMEALGQLTSGVAHDFNNLLTVVLGNTKLLRRRIKNSPEKFTLEDADKKIEAIETAAIKGADLVRRMMVFTRQSQLSEEVVDVNKCVSETVELLKRTLGEMISVEIIAVESPWPVSIDVREFENALINLAVNARDAMPKGGKLTIETGNVMLDEAYTLRNPDVVAGPYVLVSVSDTGTGIDQEYIKRIFEPFFTTKETGKGTGLGLSMVYGFIRQSRGHVHVYSELGHGTVFRIYLPRVRVEGDSGDIHPEEEVPDGQEMVLVVEDDEDVRIMAANMLEKLGYRTLQAENGHVALEIMKKEHKKIDLVFTDIVMPGGMSGIELVQRVREYYPDVKVLYTSGYTQNAIPDYQLSVGEELISKPYRREALALKVRKVLDRGKVQG